MAERLFYEDSVPIERLATQFAWPAVLVQTFNSEWLAKNRVPSENNGRIVTRLYRRLHSGFVQPRWADVVMENK